MENGGRGDANQGADDRRESMLARALRCDFQDILLYKQRIELMC